MVTVYTLPLPPPPYPLPPFLPVPNKPYGFCGRQAPCLLWVYISVDVKHRVYFGYIWVNASVEFSETGYLGVSTATTSRKNTLSLRRDNPQTRELTGFLKTSRKYNNKDLIRL